MLMSPCFICGRQPLSKGIDNAVTCLLLCDDVTDIVRVLFLSTVTFFANFLDLTLYMS